MLDLINENGFFLFLESVVLQLREVLRGLVFQEVMFTKSLLVPHVRRMMLE